MIAWSSFANEVQGAKFVVRFMPTGKGVDVGYMAHPSYVHVSPSFSHPFNTLASFVEESELSQIAGPLSISAAETDHIFPAEKRHKSETILVETKQPYQINLFSGVVHGFAVRCELSNKLEKYAMEQAFLQAVAWFNTHLL
jgi:dienelactone hydrolase